MLTNIVSQKTDFYIPLSKDSPNIEVNSLEPRNTFQKNYTSFF